MLSEGPLLDTPIFISLGEDWIVLLCDPHMSLLLFFGHHIDSDNVHRIDNFVFYGLLGRLGELTTFHR